MYEPCMECLNRGRTYSEWCNENCSYAVAIKDLKEYVLELGKYRAAVADANERLANMLSDLCAEEDCLS